MARTIQTQSFSFSYNAYDDDRNDIKRFNLDFENPEGDEEIIENMNTYLRAAGFNGIVVRPI